MWVLDQLGWWDGCEVRRGNAAIFLQREATLDNTPYGIASVVACNDTSDAGTADGFAEGESWAVGGFIGADKEAAHVRIERREKVMRCEAMGGGLVSIEGSAFDHQVDSGLWYTGRNAGEDEGWVGDSGHD